MLNRIKALFLRGEDAAGADNSTDALARRWLQDLRERELSAGSHFRRGIPVTRAPGQTFTNSSDAASAPGAERPARQLPRPAKPQDISQDNFALSMVIGAATASAALGCAAGGFVSGAAAGISLSDSASDSSS